MVEDRRESVDPTAPASTYYTTGRNGPRQRTRTYTVSVYKQPDDHMNILTFMSNVNIENGH